jgi:transposase
MKKLYVSPLSAEQKDALEELYRKTNVPRVRTRAQMVLLSAEKRLIADEIAEIVRESSVTVLRWLHRYLSEGVEGLKDEPRSGHPSSVTPEFRKRLLEVVRRRPRSLNLEYSMWTLQRLADFMAELAKEDIVFSRPQHTITSPDPEYQVKKRRRRKLATG